MYIFVYEALCSHAEFHFDNYHSDGDIMKTKVVKKVPGMYVKNIFHHTYFM